MTTADNGWVERFFSAGNGWSLEKLGAGEYSGVLQTHLENMLAPCLISEPPFIVPRLGADKQLWFYVIGSDRRELDEFQRVVNAFLGSVRTLVDPRIFVSSEDAGELTLLETYPHGFGRLRIPIELNPSKNEVYEVLKALNLAVDQFKKRPPGLSTSRRPTGKVLSDFFVACGRDDGVKALEYAEELRESGDISPRNLVAIELQALAAGHYWRELLGHAHLVGMLQGRISTSIQNAVLDAVANLTIDPDRPSDHDIADIEESLRDLATLFLRPPHLDVTVELSRWKTWTIGAAALGYPHVLAEISQNAVDKEWLDELIEWAALTPDGPEVVSQDASILDSEPSLKTAVALLQESLTANQKVGLKIFERLSLFPDDVLETIKEHRKLQSAWDAMRDEYEKPSCYENWHSWLRSLTGDYNEESSEQDLIEQCQNWAADGWNEVEVASGLYDLVDGDNAVLVRNTIPIIRKWLQDREIAVSADFIELQVILLEIDDVYSVQDLALYADLIGELLSAPHTKQQYAAVVNSAIACWNRIKSVRALDYALEAMDVLLDSPCPNEQSRLDFWNAVQVFCIANWTRLSTDLQLVILRIAGDTVGCKEQFPSLRMDEGESTVQRQSLANKRLAIYTLTEGAARRARAVLSDLYPDMDIRVNHDKTATADLINLAESADYFIFASRSASHQAFFPVTKRRDDILYPAGKGSSSIVRCFLDAVHNSSY